MDRRLPIIVLLLQFVVVPFGVLAQPNRESTSTKSVAHPSDDSRVLNVCLSESSKNEIRPVYYLPAVFPNLSTTDVLRMLGDEQLNKVSANQRAAINEAAENFMVRQKHGEKPDRFTPQDKRIKLWSKARSAGDSPGYESGETVLQITVPGYSAHDEIAIGFVYYYLGRHAASNLYVLRRQAGEWKVLMGGFQATL